MANIKVVQIGWNPCGICKRTPTQIAAVADAGTVPVCSACAASYLSRGLGKRIRSAIERLEDR